MNQTLWQTFIRIVDQHLDNNNIKQLLTVVTLFLPILDNFSKYTCTRFGSSGHTANLPLSMSGKNNASAGKLYYEKDILLDDAEAALKFSLRQSIFISMILFWLYDNDTQLHLIFCSTLFYITWSKMLFLFIIYLIWCFPPHFVFRISAIKYDTDKLMQFLVYQNGCNFSELKPLWGISLIHFSMFILA